MSVQIFGVPVTRGVAVGRAVLVASSRMDVAHYFISAEQVVAEVERLRRARDAVCEELTGLKALLPADAPAELGALLDVHLMLLADESLSEATRVWIEERHYNAEWALSAQLEVLARQFDEMEDDYLRERKADVEQVVERVLAVLARGAASSTWSGAFAGAGGGQGAVPGEDLILVANDVAPADMLQFKKSVFRGFATDVGGKTSHTAIVARSLDIPAVVGARELSRLVRQDDLLVIDGDLGVVLVNPPDIVIEEYRYRQRASEVERARLDRLRHTPAITLDGARVELLANIELPEDAATALEAGAVGVGLFRSEFLFMNREGNLPGEEEQFERYRDAVVACKGLPVTVRTVDIGADKPLDRLTVTELRQSYGLNPALGLRAIRWSLSEPGMFRQQLRAILRASAYGGVNILFPMLAHEFEVRDALQAVRRAREQLEEAGKPFGPVRIGAMVEVPAAAINIRRFARHFDFVSIGTNDLIQYTLAIDRADEQVSHLYDPWHPAVLRLIHSTISTCNELGVHVSVCGEMAGDPVFSDLLLGLGLRSFSMHPARLAQVKQRLLRADAARCLRGVEIILASDDPQLAARRLGMVP